MDNTEFTWKGTLMVFWAITWRGLVVGLPIAIVVAVALGIGSVFLGVPKDQGMLMANIATQIILFLVYICVLKRLFTKGFGKYRLAVLEK